MYHVAFINLTEHKIIVAEEYDTEAEAIWRLGSLNQQWDLEEAGFGSFPKGHEFSVYGTAPEPFAWPVDAEAK